MDKLYMILLCLMIVPILICIKYSRKIKSDVASSIVKCLIFAIVTILSNGLSAFSGNETFSYIMEALYRFSFDLMPDICIAVFPAVYTCFSRGFTV